MGQVVLFFTVIFVEGYVVLASELLAMRQLVPFVGNGTETIAIIIASVLMPLAIGYYQGGRFQRHKKAGKLITVREKLIRNLINATLTLTIGLSYIILEMFFLVLDAIGIQGRIMQASVYCALFLVYPVYLLGQTVPLISNYFSQQRLASITGRMLCYSTIGSFTGSIISTLVFMTYLGVHNTVIITIGLLTALIFLFSKRLVNANTVLASLFLLLAIGMNSPMLMNKLGIVSNNNYNMVVIEEVPEIQGKKMLINRSNSSLYAPDPKDRFNYIQYIEQNFLNHIAKGDKPKEILVIGAGGFTVGQDDTFNHYTYIDIDPALLKISEEHFLPNKLTKNKKFFAQPARAFISRTDVKYDLILLDAYTNVLTIPFQLITTEFFASLKSILKPDGIFLANFIVSPVFTTKYSIKIDRTVRTVFPFVSRHVIQPFNAWERNDKSAVGNVIYSYYHAIDIADGVYTDDKNTYYLDRQGQ